LGAKFLEKCHSSSFNLPGVLLDFFIHGSFVDLLGGLQADGVDQIAVGLKQGLLIWQLVSLNIQECGTSSVF
jgi:hypothetical protein